MTIRKEINSKTFDLIDNKQIEDVEMRTIGLLDVFGKIEIDITYKNGTEENLIGYSPVDTNQIKSWLMRDSLFTRAKMYKF